ncbi:MAG: AAA family ATPase [Rhizobiaceae bacterium]|nr:AAA family ATPase [Rhizobiaceae bacterium]
MPNYISLKHTAEKLKSANRVLVVGCSGGGKTTLSCKIAKHFDLEYQSIDRDVRWLANWTERDREEQREIIRDLVKGNRWIMDGSGPSTFDLRLKRADLVLWVRVPRHVAFIGLAKRVRDNFGTVRFGMTDGCEERLPDRGFLSYIWNFEKKSAPIFEQKFDEISPDLPIAILKSHKEMQQLF